MRTWTITLVGQRALVTTSDGPSRKWSKFMTAVLIGYKKSGRPAYRRFAELFLNFEIEAEEPAWAFLVEQSGAVRERVLQFAERVLELDLALTGFGDGSWYFTRQDGPVNHRALAFSVIQRMYEVAASSMFNLRKGRNPLITDHWWTLDEQGQFAHCVKVFGPENAAVNLTNGGRMFIRQDAEVYAPSGQNPETLGERQFAAVKDVLGVHAVTCIVAVNRDDGQRWADVANITFLHWAVCDFDCEFWGSNKRGKVDRQGRRKPQKLVGFSPETRDLMIANVEIRHQRDPARFPSMAQFRAWRDEGNFDELDRWFVFFKPMTNEPYSYSGYHRLEVKSLLKHKVLVYRRGRMRPATSRWARRALHEREWLKIHESTRDPKIIAYLEQQLSDERGHKSPQHHRYASHGKHQLARKVKNQRSKEQETARKGQVAPPRALPDQSRASKLRLKAGRSPAGNGFALARRMKGK